MIKTILFDVDGVLLDSFEANYEFFANIFDAKNIYPFTKEDYKKLFHLPMREVIENIAKFLDTAEIDEIMDFAKTRRNDLYPVHLLKLPADALQTIQSLSVDYQLGIVTSRINETVYNNEFVKKYLPFMQVVVTLDDVKNKKPHPEPILLAMEKLEAKPEETVYIGDALTDLQSAHAAGTKFIAYQHPELKEAEGHIKSFSEIAEVIKNLI